MSFTTLVTVYVLQEQDPSQFTSMFVSFFDVKMKLGEGDHTVSASPSLRNLLGIRRLGQEGEKMRRAWSHRARFLEPVNHSSKKKKSDIEAEWNMLSLWTVAFSPQLTERRWGIKPFCSVWGAMWKA